MTISTDPLDPDGTADAPHLRAVPDLDELAAAERAPGDAGSAAPPPRLSRHTFTLSDGHRIGLAVSGHGVPLVVVHGFTAEGFLYAQTLRRLVSRGFRVIAIDMAGHGGTQGLPLTGSRLGDYSELMARAVSELGIRRAVFAGHSMGGRVAAGLAALYPDRVISLLLIDAIVGDPWDLMVNVFRLNPVLLAGMGAALTLDTVTTLPVVRDPRQAVKLGRLVTPTLLREATRPWRLWGPGLSIVRSRGSRAILDELARAEVPVFVIHGDRDVAVPLCTGRSAARRSGGTMVRVRGAGHSWLLKDPETLPAIVVELLEGRLGAAVRASLPAAGASTVEELEAHFYEPGAPVLDLTPPGVWGDGQVVDTLPEDVVEPIGLGRTPRSPRYGWTVES